MPLPKVLACDLDSTLAESKAQVTPEMGELLKRLLTHIPVAIMSGGAYFQFQRQVLTALPTDTNLHNLYLFPVCAGYCFNYRDSEWKLIDDHSLTKEEKVTIRKALHEAMRETGFEAPPERVWGERIEDRGALIAFSGLGQQAPVEEKKKWDPDKAKRRPLHGALVKRLPEFEIKMNATTTIDITKKGITKAYGVRKLSEYTGVAIPEMLYIGDALFPGGNDEVVKETGIPTRQTSGPLETARIIEEMFVHV